MNCKNAKDYRFAIAMRYIFLGTYHRRQYLDKLTYKFPTSSKATSCPVPSKLLHASNY